MSTKIKKIEIPEEKEWKRSLQKYIREDLVPRILPLNSKMGKKKTANILKMRSIIASDEAMEIWVPAFTHPTFDPKIDQNFEVYEYIGDKMLSYALGVYMKKKFPYANQDHLNNFDTSFTSRKPLAYISKKTKLIDHVRTIEKLTDDKEISDIFESVVGAISKIGDELIGPGVGFIIAYNYITSIYNWYDDELGMEKGETSYVNQVMQGYYDSLGWKKIGQSNVLFEDWNNETKTLTVYLTPEAITMLTKMGNPPEKVFLYQGKKRAILATAPGPTRKKATDGLYRIALRNLQTIYKISPRETKILNIQLFFDGLFKNKTLSKKESASAYTNIIKRMKRDGYLSLKIRNYETKEGNMFILYGVMADEITESIVRGVFKDDKKVDTRYYLYKAYIDDGKMKDKYTYYEF